MNDNERPRVIGIGPNKCGTTSLAHFLRRAGWDTIHWRESDTAEPMALRMYINTRFGRPMCTGFERYNALINMDYFCEHHEIEMGRYLHLWLEEEPADTLFIYPIRSVDAWIRSRLQLGWQNEPRGGPAPAPLKYCLWSWGCLSRASFVRNYARRYGMETVDQVARHLRTVWYSRLAYAKRVIPPERLLVLDIDRPDAGVALADFLGLPPDHARYWTHENRTPSRRVQKLWKLVPIGMRRRFPRHWGLIAKRLLHGI